MSKFRCASDFMTESKRIYRVYIDCEKQMKKIIKDVSNLNDLTSEAKERECKKATEEISRKRAGMKMSLSALETKFANWAYDFADLEGAGLSRSLVQALNSGITYSQQELLHLAKKCGNDQSNARLLHDYAKSHGYELKNYVSPEQKIEKFHKMNEMFGKFADDEESKDWLRLPDNEIDIYVGNQLSSVEITPENMEIRPIAKSLDERIERDIEDARREKAKQVDQNGEFLTGFGVEAVEPDVDFYKSKEDREPEKIEAEKKTVREEMSEKVSKLAKEIDERRKDEE